MKCPQNPESHSVGFHSVVTKNPASEEKIGYAEE
jgi:hypothetical protein